MLNALLIAAAIQKGSPPQADLAMPPLYALRLEDDGQKTAPKQTKKAAAQAKHAAEIKSDVESGKKYAVEVEKQLKLSTDTEIIHRVQRLGAEMAAIANHTNAIASWGDKRFSEFDYSFKVVQGTDVNAFSLPGGYIYVYEGAVKYCESDDELAGIIAHEIAHAAFRHVATMQAQANKIQKIQIPLVLAALILGGANAGVTALQGTSLIGQAYTSGWSVEAEEAADYGGMQYMLKSPYDPSGMVTIQERLARDEHSRPKIDWGIYQTHPPSRARVESLTHYMQAAKVPLRRSQVTTSFRAQVKPQPEGVDLWFNGRKLYTFIGAKAQQRADEAAGRMDAFFDEVPQMFQVQAGDGGQILGDKKLLMVVTPEEAAAAKKSLDELTADAAKEIRGSLYMLAYRVWDAR